MLPAAVLFIAAVLYWAQPYLKARAAEDLSSFSGQRELKEALWKISAHFPPAGSKGYETRSLSLTGDGSRPPYQLSLGFDSPWSVWPVSLCLTAHPDEPEHPGHFVIRDKRPFGSALIDFYDPADRSLNKSEAAARLISLLKQLDEQAGHLPKLAPVDWREEQKGLHSAEASILYGARAGRPLLRLVRVDPALFALKPFHEKDFPGSWQMDLPGWAVKLPQAAALINAGQFAENRGHLGWLKRDGSALASGRPHGRWKGELLSSPLERNSGAPRAAVNDLSAEKTAKGLYRHGLQSFMVLDASGRIRAADSRKLASHALVAEDRQGRLLLIMTPAIMTIYELAEVLKSPELNLKKAMYLDGGFEAQLLIQRSRGPVFSRDQRSFHPKWGPWPSPPGYIHSLPAVLAVIPEAETVNGR